MHLMTGKEPTSLGQDPQEEQNTSSIKIKAAMTAPQIVMMNATCNTRKHITQAKTKPAKRKHVP